MNRRSPVSPTSNSNRGFLSILQNRRFLIFWIGEGLSQLGDKIYLIWTIGLIAHYYQAEGQPISGWVSAIMIAFTIPAFLFGTVAGVYVDRWPKKPILVNSNLVRGLLVFVVLPLLWGFDGQTLSLPVNWLPSYLRSWHSGIHETFELPTGFLILLFFTFINSTITQFFAPAEQVTIPLIVRRRDLLGANSLFTTTMMAMMIIGFAIGEPLLEVGAKLSEGVGLSEQLGKTAIVGGAYVLAAGILTQLKFGEKRLDKKEKLPHVWQDIQEGVLYLGKNSVVRNALIQLVILFSIFAALSVLAVRIAETIPGLKADQFGFLLAGAGTGMALGAGIIGNWGQRFDRTQMSLWGSLGVSLSLLSLALSVDSLFLTWLMTVFLGVFAAFVGVPMQTAIQEETPVQLRGKIFGLQNNAVNIALSLPLALAGVAETLLGVRPVLVSLALFSLTGGLLSFIYKPVKK
ncbi:MFS transporter [Gloeothece verrucosa]|uniref:Major facilitator superfamily MFS_1 n=1 Tax=Gloeothece verrucosa (strain PCC 7822) TaxID=497965 RepID=E0UCG9_GLOV7|nr:MFS transporter [Gloeothece verrucosa]ADN14040.1 major facilitator superfamily MFS_1 [Gloeothece verrucosa PCC 7822]